MLEKRKKIRTYCNYDMVTPAILLPAGKKMSRYDIEELKCAYLRCGWIPLEGEKVVAFVSPNGEWFNSYEKDTGYRYIFGTEWAKNATNKGK